MGAIKPAEPCHHREEAERWKRSALEPPFPKSPGSSLRRNEGPRVGQVVSACLKSISAVWNQTFEGGESAIGIDVAWQEITSESRTQGRIVGL